MPDGRSKAEGAGAKVVLALTPPAGAGDPGALRFFPYEEGRIEASAPQVFKRDGDAYLLTLPVASQLAPGFTRVVGVVTATNGLAHAGGLQRAAIVDVPLTGSVVAGPKPVLATPALNVGAEGLGAGGLSLGLAVLFAFLGGIVLNLMPCVFPVLSLKVMGFVTHQDSKATLHREAGAFAAGVVLTFVALGVALLSLRATGEQLGWGFQLQSPGVITALALLFTVLALNLSGVFEFGQLAPAAIRGWTSQNRTLDAFGSGVLAVIVASPCTAPFMGAALGYAIVQTTASTIAVFVALGAGMALPYVLLAWFPGWRRRLPKPGVWMVRFKQFLAFPLYATVAWLAWVLGVQLDNDAVLRLLATLVAVAFALWAWHALPDARCARLERSCTRRRYRSRDRRAAPDDAGGTGGRCRDGSRTRRRDGSVAALHAGTRHRADRRGPGRVRRFHGRMVRDLPGEQEPRTHRRRGARRIRQAQRRAGARRLDPPRPGHHAGAHCARPQRCTGVRIAPAGQATAAVARGLEPADGARRPRDDLNAPTMRTTILLRACSRGYWQREWRPELLLQSPARSRLSSLCRQLTETSSPSTSSAARSSTSTSGRHGARHAAARSPG